MLVVSWIFTLGGVVSFADPSVLRTFYCLSIFDRLRLPRFRQSAKMTAAIRNIRQRYHHRLSSRVVPQHNLFVYAYDKFKFVI